MHWTSSKEQRYILQNRSSSFCVLERNTKICTTAVQSMSKATSAFLRDKVMSGILLGVGILAVVSTLPGDDSISKTTEPPGFPAVGSSCDLPEGKALDTSPIEGGSIAGIGQWPWTVLVIGENRKHCGGTLIANQWVLTAAHCEDPPYTIRLGFVDKNSSFYAQRRASLSVVHPLYSNIRPWPNDIMMIKLDEPVSYTATIRPLCLPEAFSNYTQWTDCFMSGWGTNRSHYGIPSRQLKYLRVKVVSHARCQRKNRLRIHNSQLCGVAGSKKKPQDDTCIGDSGGPLSCKLKDQWYVVGLLSSSRPCNFTWNAPAEEFYVRVSHYIDWINSVQKAY